MLYGINIAYICQHGYGLVETLYTIVFFTNVKKDFQTVDKYSSYTNARSRKVFPWFNGFLSDTVIHYYLFNASWTTCLFPIKTTKNYFQEPKVEMRSCAKSKCHEITKSKY